MISFAAYTILRIKNRSWDSQDLLHKSDQTEKIFLHCTSWYIYGDTPIELPYLSIFIVAIVDQFFINVIFAFLSAFFIWFRSRLVVPTKISYVSRLLCCQDSVVKTFLNIFLLLFFMSVSSLSGVKSLP